MKICLGCQSFGQMPFKFDYFVGAIPESNVFSPIDDPADGLVMPSLAVSAQWHHHLAKNDSMIVAWMMLFALPLSHGTLSGHLAPMTGSENMEDAYRRIPVVAVHRRCVHLDLQEVSHDQVRAHIESILPDGAISPEELASLNLAA
eukprot:2155592-Amphidinium_carterae.1